MRQHIHDNITIAYRWLFRHILDDDVQSAMKRDQRCTATWTAGH